MRWLFCFCGEREGDLSSGVGVTCVAIWINRLLGVEICCVSLALCFWAGTRGLVVLNGGKCVHTVDKVEFFLYDKGDKSWGFACVATKVAEWMLCRLRCDKWNGRVYFC